LIADARTRALGHDDSPAVRDPVTRTLREYADRGVFRGLRAVKGRGGRVEYTFLWLTGRPITAIFDPTHQMLTFRALFPAVKSTPGVMKDIERSIAARRGRDVPAHKRFDARRARVGCMVKGGALSLTVEVLGASHEYTVRRTLSLINDLFVLLHETYPDYLVAHFGISSE
jgi:hypothetical protein